MQRSVLSVREQIQRAPLSQPNDLASTKVRLARAYLKLVSTPFDQSGARRFSLAKHGDCEVQLVEFSPNRAAYSSLLWIELYDTLQGTALDCSECHDLGEAALATERAIVLAKNLARGENA